MAQMISQSDVYRLFKEIDRLPGIMEPRLGRWRAWPMAKLQLVWHLMVPPMEAAERTFLGKVGARLGRYASDLAVMARQARRVRTAPPGGTIAMIYLPRIHQFVDGNTRDIIFGSLLQGEGLSLPVSALEQPWPFNGRRHPSADGPIYLDPYQSIIEIFAAALMQSSPLRQVSASIDALLQRTDLPISPVLRRRKILVALAMFEARRRMFRYLLKQRNARELVVTYAPGRFGEIAAARELGISSVELQHGVVSAHCPDYAWPAEYAGMKAEMPVPDRTAAFGPIFHRQFLDTGFWSENEVVAVGAAAMEHYQLNAKARSRRPGPLRLLFMTQMTSRDAALPFWRRFLESSNDGSADWELAFKLHPEEGREVDSEAYGALAGIRPGRVKLLLSDTNPIEAMLDADIVLSYNSLALVEALGLGRPPVSLCGGAIPNGFVGSFGFENLVSVMPHVKSPEELQTLLRNQAANTENFVQWQTRALSCGKEFFVPGFTQATTQLINSMIGPACCSRLN